MIIYINLPGQLIATSECTNFYLPHFLTDTRP